MNWQSIWRSLRWLPCWQRSCVRILLEKNARAQSAGVGRIRRSLVHPGLRRAEPLQGFRIVHGIERRTGGEVARRQRRELRRNFAVERCGVIDCDLRIGRPARSVENSQLQPASPQLTLCRWYAPMARCTACRSCGDRTHHLRHHRFPQPPDS